LIKNTTAIRIKILDTIRLIDEYVATNDFTNLEPTSLKFFNESLHDAFLFTTRVGKERST